MSDDIDLMDGMTRLQAEQILQERYEEDDTIDAEVVNYGLAILDCNDTFVYEGSPEYDAAEKKAKDIGLSITRRLAAVDRAVTRGDDSRVQALPVFMRSRLDALDADVKHISDQVQSLREYVTEIERALATPTETTDADRVTRENGVTISYADALWACQAMLQSEKYDEARYRIRAALLGEDDDEQG